MSNFTFYTTFDDLDQIVPVVHHIFPGVEVALTSDFKTSKVLIKREDLSTSVFEKITLISSKNSLNEFRKHIEGFKSYVLMLGLPKHTEQFIIDYLDEPPNTICAIITKIPVSIDEVSSTQAQLMKLSRILYALSFNSDGTIRDSRLKKVVSGVRVANN